MSEISKAFRLDWLLSNSGCGTRKSVKHLIHSGVVTVNGEVVRNPNLHIDAESDVILVEDRKVELKENAYFMMNKESGAVCSKKEGMRKTVFDFLSDADNRKYAGGNLSTIGRLDADTEGLLIITSDGCLIHRITQPKNEVPKTYLVFLKDPVSFSEQKVYAEKLLAGIHIGAEGNDGEADCRPAFIEWKDEKLYHDSEKKNPSSVCLLTITEGRFHEVKRIFRSLKNEVVYLKRVKINGLDLDETLDVGCYRPLTKEEIILLDKGKI